MPGPEPAMVSVMGRSGDVVFMGTDDRLVAALTSGALYRSTDGGQTWRHARLGGRISHFLDHPTGVYVGANGQLYRSTDGGLTWANVTPGGAFVVLTALTAQGNTLFASFGSYGGSTFVRSTDGGQTWEELEPARTLVVAIGDVLYARGFAEPLHQSLDGGDSWAPVTTFPDDGWVAHLTEADGYLFTTTDGTGAALYRSADGGQTWTFASTGLQFGTRGDVVRHGGAFYTGIAGGIFRGLYVSHNDGLSWVRVVIPALGQQDVAALLSTGTALLIGTPRGAFRTEDEGATWLPSSQGASAALGIDAVLAEADQLLVGAHIAQLWGRGIWRTQDAGSSWQQAPPFTSSQPRVFLRHDGVHLAGLYGQPRGTIRSTDGGATWSLSNTGMWAGTVPHDLHVHEGVVFAANHDALYRSTDGGQTWVGSEPAGVHALLTYRGGLYAGHYSQGVLRWVDGGQTWSSYSQGLTGNGLNVQALAEHRGALFAGTHGMGVWRLDGDQWTHVGPGGARVQAMLAVPQGLVIGLDMPPFVYATTDGGANWAPFGEGLVGDPVGALAADAGHLYVGVRTQGLWKRRLGDLGRPSPGPVARLAPSPQDALTVYPNPASGAAALALEVDGQHPLRLQVVDVLGREVARWEEPSPPAGAWRQTLDTSRLTPGVYFVRARAGEFETMRRLVVVR